MKWLSIVPGAARCVLSAEGGGVKALIFSAALSFAFALFLSPKTAFAADSVSIGDQAYSDLAAALAASNDGDTLSLNEDITLDAGASVDAAKHLTLDLAGHTLSVALDVGYQYGLNVTGEGSFTLRNGSLKGVDKNADGVTSGGLRVFTASLDMDGIQASGFHTSGEGSVLHYSSSSPQAHITISNSVFKGNSTSATTGFSQGGAVYIKSRGVNADARILGSTFEGNSTEGRNGGLGGGVAFVGKGTFLVKDSTFRGNRASATGASWDIAYGGALSCDDSFNNPGSLSLTLEGNTFAGNRSKHYGGAVHFQLDQKIGSSIFVPSGLFEDNSAGYMGGGISHATHGQPPIKFESVFITGNKACAGAGIWACPTSEVETHSTLGGTIVGNELILGAGAAGGTDIRFEGSDTLIPGIADDNDPLIHRMTVSPRTQAGYPVDWYADEPGKLHEEGDDPVSADYYTDRATSFGLYGELPKKAVELGRSESRLVFVNNSAVYGGAISTNSPVSIGVPEDVEVSATKTWLDEDGRELAEGIPDSVDIELWRIDDDGKEVKIESSSLAKAGKWSKTFSKLPSRGVVEGREVGFRYEVRETTVVDGFDSTSKVDKTADGNYEATLTNARRPKVSIDVAKVWDDSGDASKLRPVSVTAVLMKKDVSGNLVEAGSSIELSAANKWAASFEGLPKFDDEGKVVEYSVRELEVEGYESVVSGDAASGFTITNKLKPDDPTPPGPDPETGSVSVRKIWKDAGGKDGSRPDGVKVQLLKSGKPFGEPVYLNDGNGWAHTWEGLAKKEAGIEIVYAVVEIDVPEGYTAKVEGDAVSGFTIINSKPEDPKPEDPKPEDPHPDAPKPQGEKRYVLPRTGDGVPVEGLAVLASAGCLVVSAFARRFAEE